MGAVQTFANTFAFAVLMVIGAASLAHRIYRVCRWLARWKARRDRDNSPSARPFTPYPGFMPEDGDDPRMTLRRDNPCRVEGR